MNQAELPLPTAISSIGVILSVVAGTLSFLSSSFIMMTIFRSKQNTQYHRIVFFMSFWDAIPSLCILLVTLPMPSNVSDVYCMTMAVHLLSEQLQRVVRKVFCCFSAWVCAFYPICYSTYIISLRYDTMFQMRNSRKWRNRYFCCVLR